MLVNSYNIFTESLKIGLCCLLLFIAILSPKNSYALYDGARDVSFSGGRCDTGRIEFSPFSAQDVTWELTNPTCIGFIVGTGLLVYEAEKFSAKKCLQPNLLAEIETQKLSGVPMSPDMIKRRAQEATKCTAFIANRDVANAGLCCGSMAATLAATAVATGVLAALWDQAGITYESARICGTKWSTWELEAQNKGVINPGKKVWKKTKGSKLRCLENLFGVNSGQASFAKSCGKDSSRNVKNLEFREYIYGGVEYIDNGDGYCKNPSTWSSSRRKSILGYDSDAQRYYMRGPANASVFACHRFMSKPKGNDLEKDRTAMQAAYDCCKQRSQETICIENRRGFGYAGGNPDFNANHHHKFCKIGQKCTIEGVTFEVYASINNPSYGCAKTYSLCPYNHLIGGGTETENIDPDDTTTLLNYCQVMKHCSKLPVLPYVYQSDLEGGYIAQACRDLKGDSQNNYGFSADLLQISARGFSAPFVQCFKETMENIFLHKAGHSSCLDPNETPINNVCIGGYNYKKGGDLPGKSFFNKIQDNVQEVIKMALIASIVAFGFAILLAVPGTHITKKTMMAYVLKIALVMYFAVGDAWQFGFMQGIIGTSNFMADLTFRVEEDLPHDRLDGCQFPRFDYSTEEGDINRYDNPQYPPSKEYLRIWDILDCKIARALGFGPEVSTPNLVMMIIGGFFTGGLGIVFFLAGFIFAFFLISMTVKAMHIFIMSITSVIILLYVSPLVITLAFFERTKDIFQKWWKQLLGFTLQPMILFAYLGILVTLLDSVIMGPVTFSPPKEQITIDGQKVDDVYGRMSQKTINCSGAAADESLYCIFNLADIKTFNGFEPIGIGIPMITSLNKAKSNTIMKAAIVMFIFSSFMTQIMGFAAKLVGGDPLKSDWGSSTTQMLSKAYGVTRGIQERAINATKKHVPNAAKSVAGSVRNTAAELTSKGNEVKNNAASEGRDHVGGGNKGGTDHVGGGNKGGVDHAKPAKPNKPDNAS